MLEALLAIQVLVLSAILGHLAWHVRIREDLHEWVQDVIAQEIRRQDDRIQKRLERIPRAGVDVDPTAFDTMPTMDGHGPVAPGQPYRR